MNILQLAYGLTGPLRIGVVSEGNPRVDERSFPRPFALVGRDARADICLDDGRVSRRHAYFQMIGGEVFCVDLLSRTGVWWEDESRTCGWVGRGQALGVGSHRLVAMPGGENGAPAGGRHDPRAPWPAGAGPLPGRKG